MEHLSGQFQATAPQYRITCGVGQAYIHPNDIFRSYQEANVACEMGSLMAVA